VKRTPLDIIDNTVNWIGKIISFAIFAIAGVVLVAVVARTIDHPVNWTFEVAYYLFGSCFLLAGSYALLKNQHVNIDILLHRLSPRKAAIINLCTWPFFFLFAGALLWGGVQMAMRSISIQEKFGTIWAPPLYPLKIMVPLGAFLILLQGIAHFIRDLRQAISGTSEIEK
jgi:TRAP-type mannitol/chloroaromatic compound transport system permease small subunit